MSRLVDFKLYLITDRKIIPKEPLLEKVSEAIRCGVKTIQLREKDLLSKELLNLAQSLKNLTTQYHAKLIINDRIDIAMAVKAEGVHCPEDALPIHLARKQFPDKLIGASTHSLQKAKESEAEGADFILFGPIYSTPSKDGIIEPKGLEALSKVTAAVKIPVFAIGGITPERAKPCLDRGAHGVGVISAILKSDNMPQALERFKQELGGL